MKFKKKIVSMLLLATMILNMVTPAFAVAAPAGNDLTCTASGGGTTEVIGDRTEGTIGFDWALKIKTSGDYVISMKTSGTTTSQRIIVDAGKGNTANITLDNVDISESCAFEINSGTVNLTLVGTNKLTSTENHAGLQQNKDAGLLTIDGTGSLNANGGTLGIGGGHPVAMKNGGLPPIIGHDGVNANIIINGGSIVANGIGGSDADMVSQNIPGGGANITINGGDITSKRAAGFDIGGGKNAEKSISVGGSPRYGAANVTITGGTVTCGSYPGGGVTDAAKIYCQIGGGYYEKPFNAPLKYFDSNIKITGGSVMGSCFNGPKCMIGDENGDLTIIDNFGTRIKMEDNRYYLYGGAYTISGTTTTQSIVVDAINGNTVYITMDNANISAHCAFEIKSGMVNLTLTGTNSLISTGDYAGLQQNKDAGHLTIGGTGSLNANGKTLGIGGGQAVPVNTGEIIPTYGTYDGTDANITINGGTIVTNGMGGSDAKANPSSPAKVGGAANITINGGKVTSKRETGFDMGGGKDAGVPVADDSQHYGTANITINGGTVICGSYPGGGVVDANNAHCQIGGGYYVKSDKSCHNCTVNVIGAAVLGNIFGGSRSEIKFNVENSLGERVEAVNSVYTLSSGSYTISGNITKRRIFVDAGNDGIANITLKGANISDSCAFEINSGTVNLTLVGTNKLTSTGDYAGLQQNKGAGQLTIGGTGNITATGKNLGIGGGQAVSAGSQSEYDGVDANITIHDGTIVAGGIGGSDGKSMSSTTRPGGAANITINGGKVTSTKVTGFDMGGGKNAGTPVDGDSPHYGTANINITGGIVTCGSYPDGGVADANNVNCQIGGGYYIKSDKSYQNCLVNIPGGVVTGNCFNGSKGITGLLDVKNSAGQKVDAIDNVYTLRSGSYTISGSTTKERIVAFPASDEVLNITMNGAIIDLSGAKGVCAFEMKGNGKTTLTLAPGSSSTIKSGESATGISATGKDFTITAQDASGKLELFGGNGNHGISGGSISGGTVTAIGGNGGSGIDGGSIIGGTVTATGGNIGNGISSSRITGGTVIGNGGSSGGTGIISGRITGGTVTGNGTGGGSGISGGSITGGTVTGNGSNGGSGISGGSITGGTVTGNGSNGGNGGCGGTGIDGGIGISGGSISGGTVTGNGGSGGGGGEGGTITDDGGWPAGSGGTGGIGISEGNIIGGTVTGSGGRGGNGGEGAPGTSSGNANKNGDTGGRGGRGGIGINGGSITGGTVTVTGGSGGNGGNGGGGNGGNGDIGRGGNGGSGGIGGTGISGGSITGGTVTRSGGGGGYGGRGGYGPIVNGDRGGYGGNGANTANMPKGTPAVPYVYTFSGMANKNVSNLKDATGKPLKNILGGNYGEKDIVTDGNGKIYLWHTNNTQNGNKAMCDGSIYTSDTEGNMTKNDGVAIVTSVTVSPKTASVEQGKTQPFNAVVNGTKGPAQTVTWVVIGGMKSGTSISATGLLTVAADETATSLRVTATSTVDPSKKDTAAVTVTTIYKNPLIISTFPPVTFIPINPNLPIIGEIKTKATVDKKGNASVTVTDKIVFHAIKKAQVKAEKNDISVELSVGTGKKKVNSISTNLSSAVQDTLVKENIAGFKIESETIDLTFDNKTLQQIQAQAGGDAQINASKADVDKLSEEAKKEIGDRPVFNLSIKGQNGKNISDFGGGSVTVEFPYTLQPGENSSNLQAYFIDANGKLHEVISTYDPIRKCLIFVTTHFSNYGIGYKEKIPKYHDISKHWAKNYIEFVVGRELLSGTGNKVFSPNAAMTRGMFVTALGRLADVDVSNYKKNHFTDVKSTDYFCGYAEWAEKNGILKGTTTTTFAPHDEISRQEMAVIMTNYAKAMKYTIPQTRAFLPFADNANIASWAEKAVKSMQMAGVIMGRDGNKFDPTGTATRAEASAVLCRYIELIIKKETAQGLDVNDSGKIIYYENGELFTGVKTVNGITYHFDKDGICVKMNIASHILTLRDYQLRLHICAKVDAKINDTKKPITKDSNKVPMSKNIETHKK